MIALHTTVSGSYPFPGRLEHAATKLADFGPGDIAELRDGKELA